MTLSPSQIEALRPGFEAWYLPLYNSGTVPTAFEAWIAAKSSPVDVTEEMVERGYRAAKSFNRWEFIREALTAALNPGGE